MNLPVVNVFSSPYEAWTTRSTTLEEVQEHMQQHGCFLPCIKDSLKARITNHLDAAVYMAENGFDNGLEYFINSYLDRDLSYKTLRRAMPSKTPSELFDYQQNYPNFSKLEVIEAINQIGHTLSEGQFLFHGGGWQNNQSNQIILDAPFSTSFCPQVALRNAEWRGKAYDAGKIDLFVLCAEKPTTNVFAFRLKGTRMGNEKEVLFNAGAKLTLYERILVKADYKVSKWEHPSKNVPISVLKVGIS